jgi:hypothetical protein
VLASPPRWSLPSRICGAFQPEAPHKPVHDIGRRARSMRRPAHSKGLRDLLCVSDGHPGGDREFCFRGPSHSVHGPQFAIMATRENKPLACRSAEPPIGIEPMTYALREACACATQPLPAQIARLTALTTPFAVGFPGHPFHESFHARGVLSPLHVKIPLSGRAQQPPSISTKPVSPSPPRPRARPTDDHVVIRSILRQ